MIDFSKIKKERFTFLSKMYEESGGSESAVFQMRDVGHELGFDSTLTGKIVDYLMHEGLIEAHGLGGYIRLSHYGIREVEEAHDHPDRPTEHFGPINIYNIDSKGQGNIINTGNNNSFSINHQVSSDPVIIKLDEIVNTLKADNKLADVQKTEALAAFGNLRSEVLASNVSKDTINQALASGANIASIGSLVISVFQLLCSL